MAKKLAEDIIKSALPHIPKILAAGKQIIVYQGQFDWKDGFVENSQVRHKERKENKKEVRKATRGKRSSALGNHAHAV